MNTMVELTPKGAITILAFLGATFERAGNALCFFYEYFDRPPYLHEIPMIFNDTRIAPRLTRRK